MEARWHSLVEKIKKINGLMGAQLENTFVAELTDSTISIGVPEKVLFLHDKLNTDEARSKLANYLNTFWGKKLEVSVVLSSPKATKKKTAVTPKAITEQKTREHKQAVRSQVENHPLVKKIHSQFKTEIKTIKEMPK